MTADICEIFSSLQGEGLYTGLDFLFIRFYRCNLNCRYCDTPAAREATPRCILWKNQVRENVTLPNPVNSLTLADCLSEYPQHYVSFTGGEPLLQAEFISETLPAFGDRFLLMETNGTVPAGLSTQLLERINCWSMDLKLPSASGYDSWDLHQDFLNRLVASRQVTIKAVFGPHTPDNELEQACRLAAGFNEKHKDTCLIFQPLTSRRGIRLGTAGETIRRLMDRYSGLLPIRIMPQIHPWLGVP